MPARLLLAVTLLALTGAPAWAQDADVEASGAPAAGTDAPPAPATVSLPEPTYDTATVKSVASGATAADKRIMIELTSGAHKGTQVEVNQHLSGQAGFDLPVVAGDEVVVAALPDPMGVQAQYQIADYQRARPTAILLALTGVLMLAVGGLRGLKTLGILALTGFAIVGVLLPLTLKGISPLPLAILLAAAIALVTTLLTSGPGRKAWAAVAGTTAGVAIGSLTGLAAAHFTRLSGMASEEAVGAQAVAHGQIDFTGLLVAGMVVGALGVMQDLALSISAAVDELAEANPGLERGMLLQAGLQVGRDLLSTSANTLFLAYLGGFLPVLLALGSSGLAGARLWHQETLAAEAATLAIGLVGLLASVPLTAMIATYMQPCAPVNALLYAFLGVGGVSFAALVVLLVALRINVRYCLHAAGRMDDPDFLPTLEGLTNSSSRPVHAFTLLTDTGGIYAEMVQAIAAAQHSVTLETYLFWSGQVADPFVEVLCERARAGVAVKLLFDADGSRHLLKPTIKRLREAGCELRFFRPFQWRQPVQYNHRTHRKLLVIDGVVGFTGGIGVADMWLGPPPWLEVMGRLEGGVVGIMQGAFFQNWLIAGGALDLGPRYFPLIEDDPTKPLGMVTNSAPIWGDSMIRLLYYAAICSAQRRLWLMSPYFLPGEDTVDALCERARAGVDVRLVLPGPNYDKALPYFASRRLYGELLEAGVQIHEYAPAMLHAKAMVVDGRWCTFGSTNFDPRSFFLNSELNVSITDQVIAAQFEAFFERALEDSKQVTLEAWRNRPVYDHLIGAIGLLIRDQL